MGIKFWKVKPRSKMAEAGSDKGAAFLAGSIHKVQSGWAKWMNRKTKGLSKKSKVLCLIIFCALSIALSFALVVRNLKESAFAIPFTAIRRPTIPPDASPIPQDKGSIRNIIRFRKYMDSLSKDNYGKSTFDSIQRARPGLMDSVVTIEKLFKQN